MKKFLLSAGFVLSLLLTVLPVMAQNKFEGMNLFLNVPTDQKSTMCALRYVAPSTPITIKDKDPSTPMKVTMCGGAPNRLAAGTRLTQSTSTTAVVRASETDYNWCFEGEDKSYELSFQGDSYVGPLTYTWIATPNERDRGFYNIKDFGAKGDGTTDDTNAIRSAFAFIAYRNGGILRFPEGDYLVTSTLAMPSNLTLEGVSGSESNAPTNNYTPRNATRIKLRGTNRAMFRIGECTQKIIMRDLELYAESSENTYGVEGVGAYNAAHDFSFDRVTFNQFFRGVYAYGLPQTDLSWQFDYVKFNQCRFIYNRDAGIYINSRNSDWKIEGSIFQSPLKKPGWNANGIDIERAMMVLIQDSFGGGIGGNRGGTFINVLDSAHLTVIGCESETMEYTLRYNGIEHPSAGDYSMPMALINNMFAEPIEFKARRTVMSSGNLYFNTTWKADKWTRIYSTGDRFCLDGIIAGCRATSDKTFGDATIVFMTGQPGEGSVKGFPTFFGTDVKFGNPVQMPNMPFNLLPPNNPNGTMLYCANCRRNTTPCQAGGNGAPAMVVGNAWSCL